MPKGCVETATVREAAKSWHFSVTTPIDPIMLSVCAMDAIIHSTILSFDTSILPRLSIAQASIVPIIRNKLKRISVVNDRHL